MNMDNTVVFHGTMAPTRDAIVAWINWVDSDVSKRVWVQMGAPKVRTLEIVEQTDDQAKVKYYLEFDRPVAGIDL